MKIVTYHLNPPIPIRKYDWEAYLDGHEESPYTGWGRTEEDAKKDLIDNWGDMYCHSCNSHVFREECSVALQGHGESLIVCTCGSDNVERIEKSN